MRHYYTADEIREAEAPLLASLPEGGLMRRAAFGLATAIARELARLTGGLSGRRVCAVVELPVIRLYAGDSLYATCEAL